MSINVDDEQAARDALKALNLPEGYLQKVAGKWVVRGDRLNENKFRQQYAKAFSVRKAKKNFFKFEKEEVAKDGTLTLTFKRI